MADDRICRAVQSQQGFVLHLLLVEPPHVSRAALPLHLDHNLISLTWKKECKFILPRTLKSAYEFICARTAQKSGRLMAKDRFGALSHFLQQTTSFRSSVCLYRGAEPAPGGVWGAAGQSTVKLWRKVDPYGQSGALDRSPWCGEPGCFHDFSRPHQ